MAADVDWASLALYLCIVVVAAPYLSKLMAYLSGRNNLIDRSRDAHQMLMRKYKLAGRMNLRRLPLTKLCCQGDRDHFPIYLGRLRGVILEPELTHVFFKQSKFGAVRWALIPSDMHGPVLGRELVVRANGVSPVGNFYEPVYPKNMPSSLVEQYRDLIDRYEDYMVKREEGIELNEQKVNSWYSAVNAKRPNTRFIMRQDALEQSQGRSYTDEKV